MDWTLSILIKDRKKIKEHSFLQSSGVSARLYIDYHILSMMMSTLIENSKFFLSKLKRFLTATFLPVYKNKIMLTTQHGEYLRNIQFLSSFLNNLFFILSNQTLKWNIIFNYSKSTTKSFFYLFFLVKDIKELLF